MIGSIAQDKPVLADNRIQISYENTCRLRIVCISMGIRKSATVEHFPERQNSDAFGAVAITISKSMRESKALSRREWLSVIACASAGALTHGSWTQNFEVPDKGLLSPQMLSYISMQGSELIVEPITSTLHSFTVCAPDLAHGSIDCPEFALAVRDTGLEFRSSYISSCDLRTLILNSSEWQYVGGMENVYRTGESWTARKIISFRKRFFGTHKTALRRECSAPGICRVEQ